MSLRYQAVLTLEDKFLDLCGLLFASRDSTAQCKKPFLVPDMHNLTTL